MRGPCCKSLLSSGTHLGPKGGTGPRHDLGEVIDTGQEVFLQLTVGMIGQARLCQSL